MRLKTIVLRNFRGYKDEVRIPIESTLTAFIGRNDIGKSTIFDALDIFFDDQKKFDCADKCVYSKEETEVRIGCVFDDLPASIILDASSTTTLADEYLLNEEGDLEIHKIYDCSGGSVKPRIIARANHPTATGYNDLLYLKNSDLKKRLQSALSDTKDIDQRSNPVLRKALRESAEDLECHVTDVELNKEDAKKIWEQIQRYIPLFALFRADRPSTDEDNEIQDPMKLAIKEAVYKQQDKLRDIQDKIKEAALDVANRTIEKLKQLDPDLARELNPTFRSEPNWVSLFKLSLTTDDQIPLNKRGSGVRRLFILSFFRAQAERLIATENRDNIIYAIEEPETSQHPNNQRAVIDALNDLAAQDGCQVLITTHVPGLAGGIPVDSLRYISKADNGTRLVEQGSDEVFKKIADALGVTPEVPKNRVRCLVCVEGLNDRTFLKHIAKCLFTAQDDVGFDPDNTPEIAIIPLGGSSLREWVNGHFLKGLGLPEIHIYDRDKDDPPKYQEPADKVNERGDGSKAFLTQKREMENYLHPSAISEALRVHIDVRDDNDVPAEVAKKVHEQGGEKSWDELDSEKAKGKISKAKRRLNDDAAAKMTRERLLERGALDEIRQWFGAIKSLTS
jgi:predicted ATP-dependent endonuclease of OLD family